MILSMTGFGRGTAVLNGREITVELRSVNSRYFEYSSRIPRTCSSLDSRLKKQLNQRISRGKVELSMTVQNVDAADTVVAVNMELARSYQQAMRDLSEQLGVKNDVSTAVLTRFPDVLTTRHADVDEEQLWQDVSAVTAQALDRFVEMRAAEGAKMKADVESRLVFLEQCVGKVESLSAGRVENYTNRLYEKLKVILQDRDIDDARVLTEAGLTTATTRPALTILPKPMLMSFIGSSTTYYSRFWICSRIFSISAFISTTIRVISKS